MTTHPKDRRDADQDTAVEHAFVAGKLPDEDRRDTKGVIHVPIKVLGAVSGKLIEAQDAAPLTRDEFLTQADLLIARATQRAFDEGHLAGYSAVHNIIADVTVLLARLADYIPAELPVAGAPPTPIVAGHRSPPAYPAAEPEEPPPV